MIARLILLAMVVAPSFAAETWKPPKTDGWIEARTEHFTLTSNAGDRPTRKAAAELERFRQSLARIAPGLDLDLRVPTAILMFRTESAFRPYNRDEHGRTANSAGYFLPGPFQNTIALDASAAFSPMSIIYHEYVHAVLDGTIGLLPQWLDEGLAEYFSTFHMRAGTAIVEIGHPIDEHLAFMESQAMLHWQDVFRITSESSAYGHGLHQGAFYAQSWLLVHYLWSNAGRARALDRYLMLLRDGTDPEEAMKTALGMDPSALATAVEAYRGKVNPYVVWDLGDDRPNVPVTVRELPPGEVLFRLGDLLARGGEEQDARRHLEAARAAGWPAAPIETTLGFGALRRKDPGAARQHLEKAAAAPTPPVEALALLAELELDEASERGEAAMSGPPEGVLRARALLERALERDGDNFDLLVSLAWTYLFHGDTALGVAALDKAKQHRPLAPEVLRFGACLLARGGRIEEAWRSVQLEIVPRNKALADTSKGCVVLGTISAARERLDAGDRQGARDVMNAAMSVIDEPQLRSQLGVFHSLVMSDGEVVIRTVGNPILERYQAAVAMANAGDHEGALRRLQLLKKEECSPDSLCRAIAASADNLAKLIARDKLVERYNEAVGLANDGRRKAALEVLEALEKDATNPEMLSAIQDLKRSLGWRPKK